MNFWEKTEKPILCLAPMADVTDSAFRHVISKYSKITHVTYTEFVSADGLVRAPEAGRLKLMKDLEYSEIERPIVAQFFSSKPEMMEQAARLAVELGFDGVDINMGCPDKSIEKQAAGAALIKNPKLAREIIKAAKIGIAEASKKLNKVEIPLSVKTRLGYYSDELETWLPELLAENPAAIVIHARTRKEMSKVSARWERIQRAVEIRDELQSKTLILGNGDVLDVADALKKCEESAADGAMLGRAVFGNPFLFSDHLPSSEERVRVLEEHIKLFDEKLGGVKSFAIMKKHFKSYLSAEALAKEDLNRLRELRYKLMRTESSVEAAEIINSFSIGKLSFE